MITIYRIQDREGRGPFKPGFSQKWIKERPDHENLVPWQTEFRNIIFISGEFSGCGCRSISQLKRWFTKPEYKKLKKFGYNSVKFEAERIIAESDIQLLFGRNKPLFVNTSNFKLY